MLGRARPAPRRRGAPLPRSEPGEGRGAMPALRGRSEPSPGARVGAPPCRCGSVGAAQLPVGSPATEPPEAVKHAPRDEPAPPVELLRATAPLPRAVEQAWRLPALG